MPAMRTCKTCNEIKPPTDFYSQTTGGLFRDCKPCVRARVRANRLLKLDYYQEFDRARANLPHRVDARKEYASTENGRAALSRASRMYAQRNPLKRAATSAVSNAIRDGRIVRQPCEQCGAARAQAHHDDYSKPLDVRWLCTKHHAEWHKNNAPKCPEQVAA